MMSATTADVIVIGGGVNGLSTAFGLAERGAGRVGVLERRYLAAGASGKSGALDRVRDGRSSDDQRCWH
ncbi:MAG: FAD-dependent oxidoreductase [Thermomicrobiales bacterium]